MDVDKQIEDYLSAMGHLSPKTAKLYRIVMTKLSAFCDNNNIKKLDSGFVDHMPAFVEYVKKLGAKGRTIQSYLTIVKGIFRHIGQPIAFTYKLTAEDKKEAQLKSINRWFTEDEIFRCLNFVFKTNHNRNHLIVRILVETGIRVNELAEIRLKDIEGQVIMIGESKTQIRYVFVSPQTANLVKTYINDEFGLLPEINACEKLFGVTVGQIKKIIDSVLNTMGINADGRGPHTFRHWCATWLFYEGGMRLEDVATLLGDTPEIIKSTYLHPTPAMLLKRVTKAYGWNHEDARRPAE